MELDFSKIYLSVKLLGAPGTHFDTRNFAQPPHNYGIQIPPKIFITIFQKNAEFLDFKEKNEGTKVKLQEL